MEDQDTFPFIPDDLLAELELMYPEVNPPPIKVSLEELWRAIGTRQVVLFLKFKKQQAIEEGTHNVRK